MVCTSMCVALTHTLVPHHGKLGNIQVLKVSQKRNNTNAYQEQLTRSEDPQQWLLEL